MLARLRTLLSERTHRDALGIYLIATCVYCLVAPSALWREHTAFNHFALMAEAWTHHRLDLGHAPPGYAMGNDFAFYADRWYVAFPAMPALLLWPWVVMAGGAERTLDGLFFLLLAGLAPAGMYLGLERVRQLQLATIRREVVWLLTSLYAFGSVYFFCAVQGTVWFAAHVVAAIGTTFFLYAAIAVRNPLGAGLALSVAIGTRPVLLPLALFFVFEWRRTRSSRQVLVRFGLPVAITLGLLGLHNWLRFGSPSEFGYRYLTIAWHARIERWGLFGYHYLARNLGLILTSLPYLERGSDGWTLQINGHGLALWVTTPVYLWLLWPRQTNPLQRGLYLSLLGVCLPSLLYQNSGWVQFGQRFSNDYAPLLILLLAVGGYAWTGMMKTAWGLALAVNLFGAVTFGKPQYAKFYYLERTQRVIYQPD